MGYGFIWPPFSGTPYFVCPDGYKRIYLISEDYIPYLYAGLDHTGVADYPIDWDALEEEPNGTRTDAFGKWNWICGAAPKSTSGSDPEGLEHPWSPGACTCPCKEKWQARIAAPAPVHEPVTDVHLAARLPGRNQDIAAGTALLPC